MDNYATSPIFLLNVKFLMFETWFPLCLLLVLMMRAYSFKDMPSILKYVYYLQYRSCKYNCYLNKSKYFQCMHLCHMKNRKYQRDKINSFSQNSRTLAKRNDIRDKHKFKTPVHKLPKQSGKNGHDQVLRKCERFLPTSNISHVSIITIRYPYLYKILYNDHFVFNRTNNNQHSDTSRDSADHRSNNTE